MASPIVRPFLLAAAAATLLPLLVAPAVPAQAQTCAEGHFRDGVGGCCPVGQVGDGYGGCRPVQCYTPGCTEIASDREYIHWSGGPVIGTCPAGAACGTPGCAACPAPVGTDCGAEGQAPNPGATTPGTTADGCCHGLTKCGESCRSCSGGRVCDAAVSLCSCPLGRSWNPRTSVCCPANQVYDLASGRCMSCPAGERVLNGQCVCQIGEYRDTSGTCGPCASPRQVINGICDCPGGQTWDAGTSTCGCEPPEYDDGSGTCVVCAPPRSVQPGANPGDPDTCDCPAGEQYSAGPPAACLPECTAPLTRQPDRSCGCIAPRIQVGADCLCPAGQVDDGVGGCREDCDTAVTGKVWDGTLHLCLCPAPLLPWPPSGEDERCVLPCAGCEARNPLTGVCETTIPVRTGAVCGTPPVPTCPAPPASDGLPLGSRSQCPCPNPGEVRNSAGDCDLPEGLSCNCVSGTGYSWPGGPPYVPGLAAGDVVCGPGGTFENPSCSTGLGVDYTVDGGARDGNSVSICEDDVARLVSGQCQVAGCLTPQRLYWNPRLSWQTTSMSGCFSSGSVRVRPFGSTLVARDSRYAYYGTLRLQCQTDGSWALAPDSPSMVSGHPARSSVSYCVLRLDTAAGNDPYHSRMADIRARAAGSRRRGQFTHTHRAGGGFGAQEHVHFCHRPTTSVHCHVCLEHPVNGWLICSDVHNR